MNTASGMIPDSWWRSKTVLDMFGKVGSMFMGAGRFNLTGHVPNGQRFVANPKTVWMINSSAAVVCGQNLGRMGPLSEQANLADIWLPQSGRFFIGNVYLESFDTARHLSVTSRSPDTGADCFSCA